MTISVSLSIAGVEFSELCLPQNETLDLSVHPVASVDLLVHPTTSIDLPVLPTTSMNFFVPSTKSMDYFVRPSTSMDLSVPPTADVDLSVPPMAAMDISVHQPTTPIDTYPSQIELLEPRIIDSNDWIISSEPSFGVINKQVRIFLFLNITT